MTTEPVLPSNQKFGAFFTLVFVLGAGYFIHVNRPEAATVSGLVALILATATLIKPYYLSTPNRWWMKFGFILGRVISPMVLGLLFFGLITPIALIMKLTGRDELRLRPAEADSYWKNRYPVSFEASSFRQQF